VLKGEVADGAERKKLIDLAVEYGRRSIAVDSSSSEGHAWLAGALGYKALEASHSEQVRIVREIIQEANTVLRLNQNDDKAYSILGSTYRALGNVGWIERQFASLLWGGLPAGGFVESEQALKKAVQLAPDVMRHSFELGVLYMDMERREEARKALEYARTLPIRVAIDLPRLKKIDELLEELKLEVKVSN
jgi:Flp pilus assembly protein TadD